MYPCTSWEGKVRSDPIYNLYLVIYNLYLYITRGTRNYLLFICIWELCTCYPSGILHLSW